MQCMVLEAFGAPLVSREKETPRPDEGEVIVKVGACGVCQTDLKICRGGHPAVRAVPVIPGHEVAGEIVEVGAGVDKRYMGKHAVIYNYVTCGQCKFCKKGRESLCMNIKGQTGFSLDGGFAEYTKVSIESIFPIDNSVPYEKAAILTDAVATPYHALVSKAKIKQGETVAVIGVGGLGLHAIQISKVMGVRVIAMDLKDRALTIAEDMGADWTLKTTEPDIAGQVMALTGGEGVDAVLELTGHHDMEKLALDILSVAGRLVVVAYNADQPFSVNSQLLVSKELEIYGARWCGREEFKQCIDLVSDKKVDPFVGEIHPLKEANNVLQRLREGNILGRAVLVP